MICSMSGERPCDLHHMLYLPIKQLPQQLCLRPTSCSAIAQVIRSINESTKLSSA